MKFISSVVYYIPIIFILKRFLRNRFTNEIIDSADAHVKHNNSDYASGNFLHSEPYFDMTDITNIGIDPLLYQIPCLSFDNSSHLSEETINEHIEYSYEKVEDIDLGVTSSHVEDHRGVVVDILHPNDSTKRLQSEPEIFNLRKSIHRAFHSLRNMFQSLFFRFFSLFSWLRKGRGDIPVQKMYFHNEKEQDQPLGTA